jgi:hypothetical protein
MVESAGDQLELDVSGHLDGRGLHPRAAGAVAQFAT